LHIYRTEPLATLRYVDDYGEEVEDTSAMHLLPERLRSYALAAMIADALHVDYETVLDYDYKHCIDLLLVVKARTWRKPTRNPYEKYM
jgi:hypothetical protein